MTYTQTVSCYICTDGMNNNLYMMCNVIMEHAHAGSSNKKVKLVTKSKLKNLGRHDWRCLDKGKVK